ncbi:membrane protein [Cryptosporangium arvum]|uniref:DoxX family protein n=1 Tax=Cryptosporangium arvum DSM 44712 TaxID=927661 RepID=A0A010YPQ9_9ACTN|nr:membrane protein [Cryptosporangium arvum]EXG82170.1 DoxX family protein [Cryptosporangium arvum DSM 44712]
MSRRVRLRQLPERLTTGVFIVNSGLSKRHTDDDTAAALHGMAAAAYPFLRAIPPQRFVRLVCAGELALGTALLLPVVPPVVAGAALTAFSTGLLGLYLRVPGMRTEGSLRPTQQGQTLAKDVWMLGIALSLLVDGLGHDEP